MDTLLRLDALVQRGISDAADSGCVAQLFIEGRLIIESGGKAEGGILVPRGNDAERNTR